MHRRAQPGHDAGRERRRARLQRAQPRGRRRRRRLLRALPRHDLRAGEGRPALVDAAVDPADPLHEPPLPRGLIAFAALRSPAGRGCVGAPSSRSCCPARCRTRPRARRSSTGRRSALGDATFKIHSSTDQRVRIGVDEQRSRRLGAGPAAAAPDAARATTRSSSARRCVDVRAGPGSESQPGQRRRPAPLGGVLARGRKAARRGRRRCARGRCARTCRCASSSRRKGDRVRLTVTNATTTSAGRVPGHRPAEGAGRAARPHAPRLAGAPAAAARLRHDQRGDLAASAEDADLGATPRRGPAALPVGASAASGGTLAGRTVRFSFVLGDRQPLTLPGRGHRAAATPKLSLEARPDTVVRGLTAAGRRGHLGDGRRAASAAGRRAARAADRDAHAARPRRTSSRASSRTRTSSAGTARVYVYETAAAPQRRRRVDELVLGRRPADGSARRRRRDRRRGRRPRHLGAQLEERPSLQRIRRSWPTSPTASSLRDIATSRAAAGIPG